MMTEVMTNLMSTLAEDSQHSGGSFYNKWIPSAQAKLIKSVAENLQIYVGGAVLFVGIIGNILCLITFQRKRLRHMPITIFLRSLAVVDLILLITGHGLVAWPDATFGMRYIDHNRVACKIYYILVPTLRQVSCFLILGFSVERCLAVVYPLKFRSIPEEKVTKAIRIYIMAIFLITALYNVHGIILFDVQPDGECDPTVSVSPIFISYIRPWLSIVLVTIIPFTVITVCNTLILREMHRSKSFRGNSKETNHNDNAEFWSVAAMLLSVSILFLVLTLPIAIAMFLTRFYPSSYWWGSADQVARSDFMWKFCLVMLYMNSAINFFCYVISGKTFRAELVRMFQELLPCLGKPVKQPVSSQLKVTELTNVV